MTCRADEGQPSYRRAVLSGLLLGFSFPPFPTYMLAWIGLLPVLIGWARARTAEAILREAFAAFFIAALIAFHWTLGHVFWIPALASLGGLLLITLLMALPFGASLPIRNKYGTEAGLTALVSFSLSLEWLLHQGPWAFPWMLMGHTQAEAFPFNQMAALTGVSGLSLWVWILNIGSWAVLQTQHARWASVVLVLGIAAPLLGGWMRTEQEASPSGATTARFVQPAVPAAEWADLADSSRVDALITRSDSGEAATSPTLVIWPETALPPHVPQVARRVQQWTNRSGHTLLTGAIREASSAPGVFFNSAVLFQPHAAPQVYDKHHLVPFAEHVPFAEALPFLEWLAVPAGGVRSYRVGTEWPLLRSNGFALGALICFESAFSAPARRYTQAGAHFLVTLTQDGWWGSAQGPRQHLAFTRLRAIETHRAVALVTVSGITALIGPTGRTNGTIPWMRSAAPTVQIPHFSARTHYTRLGPVVYWIALAFTALGMLAGITPRLTANK